ncbi:hypothetical protein ACIQXM_04920 [Arthrobacter sp. NPDC097144]|uniref:hypothetical protein n=1 Tax=Arthrobacter sp. NPDC097144 TaxID=3363946 RepID=UPI003806D2DA
MVAIPTRRQKLQRFYVASSFRNIVNVRYIAQTLESKGYVNTYDWTQNASALDGSSVTLDNLSSIGQHELAAVIGADVVVVLLPGGKGTHVELGIAIAQGRRIILHSPAEVINNPGTTSTFYHLPEVEKCHGTLEDLITMILGREVSITAD